MGKERGKGLRTRITYCPLSKTGHATRSEAPALTLPPQTFWLRLLLLLPAAAAAIVIDVVAVRVYDFDY